MFINAYFNASFEAPQRTVKKEFKLIFILIQPSEMHRVERVNDVNIAEYRNALKYMGTSVVNASTCNSS